MVTMSKKILHIAQWCCIRTYKEVLAQQDAGLNVTLMAGATGHPDLHDMVDRAIGWQTHSALVETVSQYDVAVVHTTIRTHVEALLIGSACCMGDTHLVWDCHDFVDVLGAESYDAVVVPSRGYAERFSGYDSVHTIYSKVPECLLPSAAEFGFRTYDKCIALNATLCASEPWGDYRGLQDELEDRLIVYPSGDVITGHEHLNLVRRLPYLQLLRKLCNYSRHWCGSANANVCINDCVTNKFWECLSCGATPLLRNSDEMQELLDSYDGVVPTMEQELPAMMAAYGL